MTEQGPEEEFLEVDPRKFRFAVEYLACGNMTEAFRNTFPVRPPEFNKSLDGKQYFSDPEVQAIIRKLQERMMANGLLTLEEHLEMLALIRDKALEDGKYGPAVTAEVARGKAAGLYIERREINVNNVSELTTEELERKVLELQSRNTIDVTPEKSSPDESDPFDDEDSDG